MKKNIICFFLFAIVAIALTTCETISAITDVSSSVVEAAQAIGTAAEEIEPEQAYFLGRAVGANILSTYRVYNGNPGLTAYLNRICGAITVNTPPPELVMFKGYFVNILDTDEINAFASPGGHIFLTRGLIAMADSEDALAGVIAHEIAHIHLKHGIKSIRNARIGQALRATARAGDEILGFFTGRTIGGAIESATGLTLSDITSIFGESVGEIVSTMVTSGYSQQEEYAADAEAVKLMAAAGYDPQGFISILRAMERTSNYSGRGFDRTHPTPAQRISNAGRTINQQRVADTRQYRQARFTSATR